MSNIQWLIDCLKDWLDWFIDSLYHHGNGNLDTIDTPQSDMWCTAPTIGQNAPQNNVGWSTKPWLNTLNMFLVINLTEDSSILLHLPSGFPPRLWPTCAVPLYQLVLGDTQTQVVMQAWLLWSLGTLHPDPMAFKHHKSYTDYWPSCQYNWHKVRWGSRYVTVMKGGNTVILSAAGAIKGVLSQDTYIQCNRLDKWSYGYLSRGLFRIMLKVAF